MAYFGGVVRAVVVLVTLACAVAIGVARLGPRSAKFRMWQAPRHAAINGAFLSLTGTRTAIFNTETGAVVPFRLPEGDVVDWVSFSDWITDDGESEIVGRWAARTGTGSKKVVAGMGLGRFGFPSGRPLDRVRLDHPPAGPPCWFPGGISRVLYAGADGNLYRYAFSTRGGAGDHASPVDGKARLIEWRCLPPGVRGKFVADPVWPRDPRLGGLLFAALSFDEPGKSSRRLGRSRIWWLALDASGMIVVAAGPVTEESGTADEAGDERFPRLAAGPDGKLLLAYQVHRGGPGTTELCAAPLEFDPDAHTPRVRDAEVHHLCSGGLTVPPVFTPRGDSVFTLVGTETGPPRLERVNLGKLARGGDPHALTCGPPFGDGPGHPG